MVLMTTSLINSKMENQKKTMTKEEFAEFNTEMARLKEIKWKGYTRTLKEIGISYLGKVAQSAKLRHSYYHQVSTYGIYLAPSTMSGFNVCPNSDYCRENCLNESGHNRLEISHNKKVARQTKKKCKESSINRKRVMITRLFFANREVFMRLAVHEINNAMKRAKTIGHFFSIRLNCTSDISPTAFVLDGKNILQMFPNVSFYDYTKVPKRLELLDKYPNYDLTWSIDGSEENREIGLEFLERGGRVAVVYGTEKMPKSWYGYDTENGDRSDYRPQDINQVCMLKFKVTVNNFKNGKFLLPQTDFILTEGAENVEW
jgi:hypothetical protein